MMHPLLSLTTVELAGSDADRRFVAELVKRKLTEEVSGSVHAIQQQFVRQQSAVISDDIGGQLCTVIEAVFLHGIRPSSWALKVGYLRDPSEVFRFFSNLVFSSAQFSSAFGISKTSVLENMNMWPLVSGVSHRDVMQRITSLKDIRTDVGRCRAWLRLAFNDGLFESYLSSITLNSEVVESYYQPWAAIRDREIMDIIRGHLLGLQNFAFNLSVENSDLNRWDRQTFVLAGLSLDANARPSVVTASTTATPVDAAEEAIHSLAQENPPDDPLTVIHVPQRPNRRKVRSVSSPLPREPSPLAVDPSGVLSTIVATSSTHIGDRADELDAILRVPVDTESSLETARSDPQISLLSTSRPLPISRKTIGRLEEEDDASYSSNHSGNLLLKNTGWSSPYDEFDLVVQPSTGRKPRADTHDSFDAVLGLLAPSAVSSSLGIGSSLFAQMVDDIQSASSSNGTPTFGSSAGTDHDFEVLNSDNFLSSKSVEGKKRELLVKIPIEKGLRAQHYKCGSCMRPIGMIFGKSRLCSFDLLYYCLDCHLEEETIIPSRVVHNWDFRKMKVCIRAKQLIDAIESTPLFDIKELNLKIYSHVKEMEEAQKLRIQLQIIKSYLWTCKKENFEQFNQKLWPHDHLHESVHIYSLSDFMMIHNGSLAVKIKSAIQFGIEHIRKCFLCSQRGFICEVCRTGQVLHAFDTNDNFQCLKCFAVFHKKCMNASKSCPKCQRKYLQAKRIAERIPGSEGT